MDELYLSGYVRRMHTWPVIKEQTLAQHQWGVVTHLHRMYPKATKNLILHAQFHDCGEIISGDVPAPLLVKNPQIKRTIDNLQTEFLEKEGIYLAALSPGEQQLLAIADRLELLDMCRVERSMGNTTIDAVYKTGYDLAVQCLKRLEQVDIDMYKEVHDYVIGQLHKA